MTAHPPGHPSVEFKKDDSIAVITIDRPRRRNAVDAETARALDRCFVRFEQDEALDVAILTGAGDTFCAGADLAAVSEGEDIETRLNMGETGPMGPTRRVLNKPVIAAIEGHAVAGGLELACWCDLRVAARGAVFGVFCRRVGVPLVDGGTVRLPRLIGQSRAMDLILTGREVSAGEALEIGLVNRLVDDGKALEAAVSLARELARLSPAMSSRRPIVGPPAMVAGRGRGNGQRAGARSRHGALGRADGRRERFRRATKEVGPYRKWCPSHP